MNFHGDLFEAKARTVGDLLDMLNDFQLFRVAGGPDWMRSDRYDIEAKADRPLTSADLQEAVKTLLADRFQLKSHREKREVAGLVLRSSRTPAGLKEAGGDERYSMRMDGGAFVFTAASMSVLANYLSNLLTAPVLDETELKGKYNFKLAIRRGDSDSGTMWEDRAREAVEAFGAASGESANSPGGHGGRPVRTAERKLTERSIPHGTCHEFV